MRKDLSKDICDICEHGAPHLHRGLMEAEPPLRWCYPRLAPNPIGGDRNPFQPWFQVVEKCWANETVRFDFIKHHRVAEKISNAENLRLPSRDPRKYVTLA